MLTNNGLNTQVASVIMAWSVNLPIAYLAPLRAVQDMSSIQVSARGTWEFSRLNFNLKSQSIVYLLLKIALHWKMAISMAL